MPNRDIKDQRAPVRYTPDRKRELASDGKYRREVDRMDAVRNGADTGRPKVKIGDSPAASGLDKLMHPTDNIERQLKDLGA